MESNHRLSGRIPCYRHPIRYGDQRGQTTPFDKLRVNGSECCVASIPVRAELVEA
jgi:hypothetical protein